MPDNEQYNAETIAYHLGGTFRASFRMLNDAVIQGRIRGLAFIPGTAENHEAVIRELAKNDVLVFVTGPKAESVIKAAAPGQGLGEICEVTGFPAVLTLAPANENKTIRDILSHVNQEGGLGRDVSDIPFASLGGELDFESGPMNEAPEMLAVINKKRADLKLKPMMYAEGK